MVLMTTLPENWGGHSVDAFNHCSSKTANSNRAVVVTALEPNAPKIPFPKSQRTGDNFCLSATFTKLLLCHHHLRCSSKVLLKSWIFWHLPYVFPIFIFWGEGKKKHLQFCKCWLSNTREEINYSSCLTLWASAIVPQLSHQHFQIHQTDSCFVPIQTTSHFL